MYLICKIYPDEPFPPTFSPQKKHPKSYFWRFPRPLKLWKKWSLPRQRWSWQKWSHGRMAYWQGRSRWYPPRDLTWQSWKHRLFLIGNIYIYIHLQKLVVFFWIVMLNLQGGFVCWVISIVVQISCLQMLMKRVKQLPSSGQFMYPPWTQQRVCTWKWLTLEDDISSWVSAYF